MKWRRIADGAIFTEQERNSFRVLLITDHGHEHPVTHKHLEKDFDAFLDPSEYPAWICGNCGDKLGSHFGGLSTWHEPDRRNPDYKCGWCGRSDVPLTEPRDFAFPEFKGRVA